MTIIYADAVMDMFHSGHVQLLKRASNLGDYLIVGLNSDDDAQSYKREPIISLENRKIVVESCKYVNKVIAPCPLIITKEFMVEHKIDYVVHAHDENDKTQDFVYKIPKEMGKFIRLEYTTGISTSDIIKKIKSII